MSHLSPASLLVWAILTSLLGTFLVFHLWSFDRFKCLRWNKSSGAFKRVMTYSYLLSVPLIATYAIGFTTIKYYEGFLALPFNGTVTKPIELWTPLAQRFNLPLMLCLSVGWSLEMVTHLEELCFWLFVINSGTARQGWFRSLYYKLWVIGSIIAITYMPIITVLTHSDPLKSEAYTFLAGGLGSISLTLWFIPILFMFPSFLYNLRSEGVDINTIVRLTKLSELNMIRVFFRFLFTVPFLILSIDGIQPHHHINETMLWTDFLAIIAGLGCSISSAITLVIFFPRSIKDEISARDKRRRSKSTNTNRMQHSTYTFNYGIPAPNSKAHLFSSLPRHNNLQPGMDHSRAVRITHESRRTGSMDKYYLDEEQDTVASLPPLRPNRKRGDTIEFGGIDQFIKSDMARVYARTSNVNHLVHNFTSPIDLADDTQRTGGPWLTFRKS